MPLSTSYLGLKLAHPFILGASPVTGQLDNARRAEDGGCAAIVMHSLFEEQIAETVVGKLPRFEQAARQFLAPLSHFSRPDTFPLRPDEYLEQLHRIKAAVSIPVIGSLNGTGTDGWLTYARSIEESGADALELNIYYLSTDVRDSGADIEANIESLVRKLKGLIRIPIAVKLSPFFTAFGSLAMRLEAAGADGLVFFNRHYQPDIDVDTLEALPNLHLSTSAELPLRLRWLAILSEHVKISLAVTGGVHSVMDGIKAVLSGAHAVQMVSAVLQQGPRHFREMEQGLSSWITRHKYDSIDAVRGSLSMRGYGEPAQFERAGYFQTLHSWSR
ncbi:MAG: dihydroorotate dehydrogenase-like protein [Vicinamibacterales bacterium]